MGNRPMLCGDIKIRVGTFHELTSRDIQRCPSYYAADWEMLRTAAGEYPLVLNVVGGYTIPMPYWVLVGIAAERVDGRLYSGFGGVNFASKELPKEATKYTMQMYDYQIPELVESGKATLVPEFDILRNPNRREVLDWFGQYTFTELREMAEAVRV